MTIRKRLVLTISLIILLVVFIYSVISIGYVKKYFSSLMVKDYEQNVFRIKEQATSIILDEESENTSSDMMEVFLSSLIEKIVILDSNGNVLSEVEQKQISKHRTMMASKGAETDFYDLEHHNEKIGTLIIGRSSAISSSESMILFGEALASGAFLSGIVAFIFAIIIVTIISSKMTKDLRMTAAAAKDTDSESFSIKKYSKTVEIRSLQQSLENLSTKLGLQRKVRKEKADQISHEVRTPLSILKSNIEGTRDKIVEMDDDRLTSCLAEVDNLSEILSTISDIVEYEKIDITPKMDKFDLIELISRIHQGFRIQFENKNIKFICEGDSKIIILSDKSLLSQSIYNIISNAYKFAPEGGTVSLTYTSMSNQIKISINDSGSGISDVDKNRIFKAYYRGENSESTKGDGLGLYIAKKNIEALGGTISLTDSVLGGASFIITLPLI